MRQIQPRELKAWLDEAAAGRRTRPVLLDVREPWELDVCKLPDVQSMPMRAVPARYHELRREDEIVVVCHHGARSFRVAMFLEQQGFINVINLYGGMAAWQRDVDPKMATY